MLRLRTFLISLLLLTASHAPAQFAQPATFTVTHKKVSEKEIVVIFHGSIDQGWHVYSTDAGEGGPTPATFNIDEATGIKRAGRLHAKGNLINRYDKIFGRDISFFENSCTFEQRLLITDAQYSITCYLQYSACNDRTCTPPTTVEFSLSGQREMPTQTASASTDTVLSATTEAIQQDTTVASPQAQTAQTQLYQDSTLWSDKTAQLRSLAANSSDTNAIPHIDDSGTTSLWWLFLMGLLGGLIAILTPCVWPIIPMTVSFFLKRGGTKRKGLRDAVIYGLSIVIIYMSLGLLITMFFGANALNALSTNAAVNIFFFLLLIAFGLSFFGLFELQLPSSWTNKADRKAETTTGFLSIFIMAFTLALVSFSCTGPIIGFMLVEVATMGNIIGPLVCMLGFAIALALPFTLFALFPTLIKRAPKSGSWMNTLKVVLGFIEIAFALKFLSVADMAYGWHLLSREAFIIIWIILAVLLGLYLLHIIKLPIDGGTRPKRNLITSALAVACFAFAAYMIPGVLGKPLKAISAFAPPMSEQHIRLYGEVVEAQFTDYEQGLSYARTHNKRVLLDFTGFGCVNCREMEMNVWNDPRVAKRLKENIVLISLFVDDKTKLPQRITVEENGNTTTLRTVGDKWSYLQRKRFGANVQPFYILCSPDGEPLAPPYSYDTNVEKFIQFLDYEIK